MEKVYHYLCGSNAPDRMWHFVHATCTYSPDPTIATYLTSDDIAHDNNTIA